MKKERKAPKQYEAPCIEVAEIRDILTGPVYDSLDYGLEPYDLEEDLIEEGGEQP